MKFERNNFVDILLINLICSKLDKETHRQFQLTVDSHKVPSFDTFIEFLEKRYQVLENLKTACLDSKPKVAYDASVKNKNVVKSKFTTLFSDSTNYCILCKCDHALFKCPKFINLTVTERNNVVKCNKLCYNCLSSMHSVVKCQSVHKCKKCYKSHHTLLHYDKVSNNKYHYENQNTRTPNSLSAQAEVFVPQLQVDSENKNAICASNELPVFNSCTSSEVYSNSVNSQSSQQILLCTVLVNVCDSSGNYVKCRALLDSGSQASFITEDCLTKLGLLRKPARIQISCLGSTHTQTKGEVRLKFTPHFETETQFSTHAYVIQKITGNLPYSSLPSQVKNSFKDLVLADPLFYKSQPIDILLGVNVFLSMLKGDTIIRQKNLPLAVASKLGWIISGSVTLNSENTIPVVVNNIHIETNDLVKRFWTLETVPDVTKFSKCEEECETHFKTTHSRDNKGRYTVKLPFKESPSCLGDSREQALRRFKNLESKLAKNPKIYDMYKKFMKEYFEKGHMEKVPNNITPQPSFYLPHHSIFKESSSTTKLRVVFDASAKSGTGVSLNDILLVGPRIQQELFPILLRFRLFPIAITADIEKMFRQIKMCHEDRDFQRIFWRESFIEPIREYRLTTVTYGTAPAPFLSTRVLQQLAVDEKEEFPLASKATLNDFYVDDLLTGASNADEARNLVEQLVLMMNKGGFTLRKWASNEITVFENIAKTSKTDALIADTHEGIKILGIAWNPKNDGFSFSVPTFNDKEHYSKREMLSEIAKVFDPLGWLSPCTVFLKILLQELWKFELTWDERIPDNIAEIWKKVRAEFHQIKELVIPRFALLPDTVELQIHAFCDASERAYCASIYLRSVACHSIINVTLLTSKTRVAPLKTQSLPRLELCAALLLANLLEVVLKNLKISIHDAVAWTDSTVALAWINSEPYRWQSFVANRVAKIQDSIPSVKWKHIRGIDNPADCATRGFYPSELTNCDLWFNGPQWLRQPLETHEISPQLSDIDRETVIKEEKKRSVATLVQVSDDEVLLNFSSWSKLRRVIAWCLRFFRNTMKSSVNRTKGFLSTQELENATTVILKKVQEIPFSDEIASLKSGKLIKNNSKILSLNPFLDTNGVIRVGGRLKYALMPENQKHPILLPKKHHITELIVKYFHLTHLHAGPQLLLAVIRQEFWILCGRDVVRRAVKGCLTCFRYSAVPNAQMMADLPANRVSPSRPFSKTGVDFAGPFLMKTKFGRNTKTYKCYISLFVCFSTKAVHLELVSDLSSATFLAALRRFISRRGKPQEIMSDCGTNFKKASKELRDMHKAISTVTQSEELTSFNSNEGIKWKFNPPSAPHFGGLWEANVKSVKYHIRRTIGNQLFSFEEFTTLLTQIEACLNSRPLCPLSNDPNDLEVLTPGHFLIGAPLTAPPEPVISDTSISRLQRWKLIQCSLQHFWKRWSTEYLSKLQQRPKWCYPRENLKIGDLVLIKNELLPPQQWRLGRVKEVHPGRDNKIRVASVITSKGELKRPIQKLCLLPLDIN